MEWNPRGDVSAVGLTVGSAGSSAAPARARRARGAPAGASP
jgi:hypothetical protein